MTTKRTCQWERKVQERRNSQERAAQAVNATNGAQRHLSRLNAWEAEYYNQHGKRY